MQAITSKVIVWWEILKQMITIINNITFSRNDKICGENSDNKNGMQSANWDNRIVHSLEQKSSIIQNNSTAGLSIPKRDNFNIKSK